LVFFSVGLAGAIFLADSQKCVTARSLLSLKAQRASSAVWRTAPQRPLGVGAGGGEQELAVPKREQDARGWGGKAASPGSNTQKHTQPALPDKPERGPDTPPPPFPPALLGLGAAEPAWPAPWPATQGRPSWAEQPLQERTHRPSSCSRGAHACCPPARSAAHKAPAEAHAAPAHSPFPREPLQPYLLRGKARMLLCACSSPSVTQTRGPGRFWPWSAGLRCPVRVAALLSTVEWPPKSQLCCQNLIPCSAEHLWGGAEGPRHGTEFGQALAGTLTESGAETHRQSLRLGLSKAERKDV
jgi:hypothetical protein